MPLCRTTNVRANLRLRETRQRGMIRFITGHRSHAGALVAATALVFAAASLPTIGAGRQASAPATVRAPVPGRAGAVPAPVGTTAQARDTHRVTIDRYCVTCHSD